MFHVKPWIIFITSSKVSEDEALMSLDGFLFHNSCFEAH